MSNPPARPDPVFVPNLDAAIKALVSQAQPTIALPSPLILQECRPAWAHQVLSWLHMF